MKKYTLVILIFLIISVLSAYDEGYVVNKDGGGDYTDIMSAVNAVQTSAVIYVIAATTDYTGANNTNISWNGTSKTIHIWGINDPVIDCNDNSRAFNLTYTTADDVIEGLTIENATYSSNSGGAIRVKDGLIKIKYNTFIDCHNGPYLTGYEMNYAYWNNSRGGAIFIEHANDNQSSEIIGNSFDNCVAFEGGAICVEEGFGLIEDNMFEDNHACYNEIGTGNNGQGGAIYLISADADIIDNEFTSNSAADGGLVISNYFGSEPLISNNKFDSNYRGEWDALGGECVIALCSEFSNNIVIDHEVSGLNTFSLFVDFDTCENNTIKNNSVPLSDGTASGLEFTNCIFDGNSATGGFFDDEEMNYCLINNSGSTTNLTLSNCILNENPHISASTYQPVWSPFVKSLCIDAGDPTVSDDDDDTPSDIGAVCAVTHRYDEIELPDTTSNNGWKWLSFPALDNVLTGADTAGYVLEDILDLAILEEVLARNYTIDWNGSYWDNTDQEFSRTEGFKFHMNDDVTLDVPGFKVADNTTIALAGNNVENWIGYWIDEVQEVSDAFEDYWSGSNIWYIQNQSWTATYSGGEWIYTTRVPTLEYGDMVVVKCSTAVNDFGWNYSSPPEERTLYAETEYFTFEEQADYVPIYVEVDENNWPQEIGAFVNGVCIGATVAEDALTQINAYTTSAPPGDIELELYYGGRSENKRLSSYNCTTSSNPNTLLKHLSTENSDDAWFVDLREGYPIVPTRGKVSLDNYPNPFNPTTLIAYSLPNDSKIELRIFNIKGQLVKTLVDGKQLAGSYEMVWNGRDNNEKSVSSGIYFYKLSTKDETIMKKMLMLK